mgnify:CR=1 FL=1
MKKILINVETGAIETAPFNQEEYGYLGGRGLVAKLLEETFEPSVRRTRYSFAQVTSQAQSLQLLTDFQSAQKARSQEQSKNPT